MKTATINVSGEINLKYDEDSKDFKEALASYRKSIDGRGTVKDMLEHVAAQLLKDGLDSMVEGVGFIYSPDEKIGSKYKDNIYAGIQLAQEDVDENLTFEID